MENVRASESEILAFFLHLLNLAEQTEHGANNKLIVDLSVQELSEALHIPLRTTIQSLNRLTACGALKRTEGKKTFPRSPTITTVLKEFYIKENEYKANDKNNLCRNTVYSKYDFISICY